ncbi:translation factor [Pluteus cervinus]|uniref:Translation factor n=1 Tax=Pluteus cervinus TaxID=181527 RepID=A0ACD3BCT5_9AGAR|nr:translation factor [Pluteus cervinus]
MLFPLQNILTLARRAYTRFMLPTTTHILKCDPSSISFSPSDSLPHVSSEETLQALNQASDQLLRGYPVAFPTETVYGLGALALDEAASAQIFATKGRPADNPLIVHVSSFEMLRSLLPPDYTLPRAYQALTKHFWPGPLTLLFPCLPSIIPSIITANQKTVAIRMPSHPVARALIALSNAPLAAPSANSSGKPSPTRAEHVFRDLQGKISIVLDGGPCGVGLESTVVDGLHEDGCIRVLRPGGVTVEDIEQVLREEMPDVVPPPRVLVHRRDYRDEVIEQAPTTPGMKYRHYSPSVPVILLNLDAPPSSDVKTLDFEEFLSSLRRFGHHNVVKVGLLAPEDSPIWNYSPPYDHTQWQRYSMGVSTDPSVAAHRLFDGLLSLEHAGTHVIVIQAFSEEREGLAIMNRVRKAASESQWVTLS